MLSEVAKAEATPTGVSKVVAFKDAAGVAPALEATAAEVPAAEAPLAAAAT